MSNPNDCPDPEDIGQFDEYGNYHPSPSEEQLMHEDLINEPHIFDPEADPGIDGDCPDFDDEEIPF